MGVLKYILPCLFFSVLASAQYDCPGRIPMDGYTKIHGDKCYRFFLNVEKEFNDAENHCLAMGGHLAMPKNKEMNDYLKTTVKDVLGYRGRMWIGLTDQSKEGRYLWADGTPMTFMAWGNNEGNVGDVGHFLTGGLGIEDCVAMDFGNGEWRRFRCEDLWIFQNHHRHFACEFEAIRRTTQSPPTTKPTTPKTAPTTPKTIPTTPKTTPTTPKTAPTTQKTTPTTPKTTPTTPKATPTTPKIQPTTPKTTPTTRKTTPTTQKMTPTTPKTAPTTTKTTPTTTTAAVTTISPTTTEATTVTPTKASCKLYVCALNCGAVGNKVDENDCVICACNDEEQ